MTALNLHECLLVNDIRGIDLVKWMWSLSSECFSLLKKRKWTRLRPRSFKRFSPLPGSRNKNTEIYNKFGHLTSLSGRYHPRNSPKCGTNITRREEPLVWVITPIHCSRTPWFCIFLSLYRFHSRQSQFWNIREELSHCCKSW